MSCKSTESGAISCFLYRRGEGVTARIIKREGKETLRSLGSRTFGTGKPNAGSPDYSHRSRAVRHPVCSYARCVLAFSRPEIMPNIHRTPHLNERRHRLPSWPVWHPFAAFLLLLSNIPHIRYTYNMSDTLPTAKLGKNGPQVTRVGFGAMGLSAFYGKPKSDEERLAFLDKVYEAGETFWDSAAMYGDSEELIGRWFSELPVTRKIALTS